MPNGNASCEVPTGHACDIIGQDTVQWCTSREVHGFELEIAATSLHLSEGDEIPNNRTVRQASMVDMSEIQRYQSKEQNYTSCTQSQAASFGMEAAGDSASCQGAIQFSKLEICQQNLHR